MFSEKPTKEQIAELLAKPADPDAKIRCRLRIELQRLVNHAALFGVEIPKPMPTEAEQIRACKGILPHRLRQQIAQPLSADPYGENLRRAHGGLLRGD